MASRDAAVVQLSSFRLYTKTPGEERGKRTPGAPLKVQVKVQVMQALPSLALLAERKHEG